MITGAHSVIYSKDAEADRNFFRDVLKFPYVDVGHGWLIFGLPPSEVAVHPADRNNQHEFYLICDDVKGLVLSLGEKKIECSPIHEEPCKAIRRSSGIHLKTVFRFCSIVRLHCTIAESP